MGFKSNIIIKSNIYVRKETLFYKDKDFIKEIRGYDAVKRARSCLGNFYSAGLLTDYQRKMLEGGSNCSYAEKGEKPFGLTMVDGFPDYVCKCETLNCSKFAECSRLDNFSMIRRSSQGLNDHEGLQEPHLKDNKPIKIAPLPDGSYYKDKNAATIRNTGDLIHGISKDIENAISPENDSKGMLSSEPSKTTVIIDDNQEDKSAKASKQSKIPIRNTSKTLTSDNAGQVIEYERILNPQVIINAPIDARTIVNAGPGTGKTYSVIKRLEYIVNNDLIDLQKVVILCFSRSAVGVIKDRILNEIELGNMSREAKQLFNGIRTFDSFATYMLTDDDFKGVINNLDYDERIEKFITELRSDSGAIEGVEYFIVDEMQDLVGVRARMVKEVLEHIQCGFLLLGDKCQAIYDYQVQDDEEMDSYKFYKWLDEKFRDDIGRFELTQNMRQKENFAVLSDMIRDSILSENQDDQKAAIELCTETLKAEDYRNIGKNLLINEEELEKSSRSIAVLCRNNAQVAIISNRLYESGFEHRVLKGAQHMDLAPWIAKTLSCYTKRRIGFSEYKGIALEAGFDDLREKWHLLKKIAPDSDQKVLDLGLLVKNLVQGINIPGEVDLSKTCSELPVISTIHRSKGREYYDVILNSRDFEIDASDLNEIKLLYVGLTRSKTQARLCKMGNFFGGKLDSGRWIGYGKSRNGNFYCKNIILGRDGDVDPFSFAEDIFEGAIERQKYISGLKNGDPLEIHFNNGSYGIYHKGFYIGRLADGMEKELRHAMIKTNRSREIPNRMTDIFVDNVVTIANTKFSEIVAPPFNKSGLWLGVEITGYAKTIWA